MFQPWLQALTGIAVIGGISLSAPWTHSGSMGGSMRVRATLDGAPWSGDSGLEGRGLLYQGDSILLVFAKKAIADSSETVRLAVPGLSGRGSYPAHNTGSWVLGSSFDISKGD